jgi:glucose-6-phosphate-specific signal transduction histidine kinase
MREMLFADADSSYKIKYFRILLIDRALYYLPMPAIIKLCGLLCVEELQNSYSYHSIITSVIVFITANMLRNKWGHHFFMQLELMGVLLRTARCSTALGSVNRGSVFFLFVIYILLVCKQLLEAKHGMLYKKAVQGYVSVFARYELK